MNPERVVLAHGCFDLLHLGHIRHLQEARSLGDKLVVSITADRHVKLHKGEGHPQFSTEQRREALLALDCVDDVVISESGTAAEVITRLRPAVFVKGPDYADSDNPGLLSEIAAVEAVGGRFHVTTAEKWSSTRLLRGVRLPDETLAYLETARERGFLGKIQAGFEKADKLKILFTGETIIDEYRYVRPLAKPSKEFILATVADRDEKFDGGVLAAAKQGGWKNVEVATDSHVLDDAKLVTKTRFVEADFSRKLFEVYSAREVDWRSRSRFRESMRRKIKDADIVVALDFGHGLFGEEERAILQEAKFLALTAQTNAASYGFNPVTNHRKAHYVCVDEPEARLALGDRGSSVDMLVQRLAGGMEAKVTITQGRYGSTSLDRKPPTHVPAFADAGFDTMGAGDAFLAVAAPLVAAGLPVEMAAFAGNVAGGLKTAILGHSRHVGRDDIVKNLEWLLR